MNTTFFNAESSIFLAKSVLQLVSGALQSTIILRTSCYSFYHHQICTWDASLHFVVPIIFVIHVPD